MERSRGYGYSYRSPNVDALRLLAVLNNFFNSHPATSPSDTTPYSCAKTLLFQLLDCLGREEVVKLLKSLKIPSTSFISRFIPLSCSSNRDLRLVDRLSNTSTSNPTVSGHHSAGSDAIRDDIVAIIERITTVDLLPSLCLNLP